MAEELDYRLEAESQAIFAAAFDGDPDFAVPHVVEGREHVIVSEWLEGLPLSRIIAEGTQEQRDTASQLYLRFLLAGRRVPGCCTPTPTRATSASRPTVAWASSTSAPSTGFPTACRRRSGRC